MLISEVFHTTLIPEVYRSGVHVRRATTTSDIRFLLLRETIMLPHVFPPPPPPYFPHPRITHPLFPPSPPKIMTAL